jgi:hypothetical protein
MNDVPGTAFTHSHASTRRELTDPHFGHSQAFGSGGAGGLVSMIFTSPVLVPPSVRVKLPPRLHAARTGNLDPVLALSLTP